jgi:hypothetical protein
MIIIETVIGIPKFLQFIKKDTGVEYTFRYIVHALDLTVFQMYTKFLTIPKG